MTTVFIRMLSIESKSDNLRKTIYEYRNGKTKTDSLFLINPESFQKVPNSPFAYWVDDSIRDLFQTLPPFES